MITYLEAIASPSHGIPASDYHSGWVGEGIHNQYANGKSYFGITLPVGGNTGGPLFFTDYSFMGFDPRGIHDRFTDYYQNNRAQALINQQYCIHNPHHWKGYGADSWGLTAVDGPDGYVPYEPTLDNDDGTIAPTGAISTFPYTPRSPRWRRSSTFIVTWARKPGRSTASATHSICSRTGIPASPWGLTSLAPCTGGSAHLRCSTMPVVSRS